MTLVRRHLVGALVVVLALAVGIALGAGPLQRDDIVPTSASPTDTGEEPAGPTADDLAAAAGPSLLGARLEGRSIAVLAGPGVTSETLDSVTAGIESGAGSVSGTWRLTESLTEPSEKALVETLGDQLVEQLESQPAEPDAPGYERIGQLIGTALATRRSDATAASQDALTVRQSLAAAGLVQGGDRDARRSPLVLVVLGEDLDDYVVGGILDGLATRSAGVVVAAPVREGDLTVVDGRGAVTTVDGIEGEAGQVAAVLALARVEETPAGSYGASGADGLLPLG
ncbi:copper transporter [Nocardioides sp.]|uniref:copper transporter n=1 Tax=Nocardioides sp. TaxID=35761 RepID=UPI002ED164DE